MSGTVVLGSGSPKLPRIFRHRSTDHRYELVPSPGFEKYKQPAFDVFKIITKAFRLDWIRETGQKKNLELQNKN